jgi:hypothetical protein
MFRALDKSLLQNPGRRPLIFILAAGRLVLHHLAPVA